MKLPVALISLFIALLCALFAFLYFSSPSKPVQIEAGAFASLSEEDKAILLQKALGRNQLPGGAEETSIIWMLTSNNSVLQTELKEASSRIPNLSRTLAETSYSLFKDDEPDLGLRSLKLARELFPSDPTVLSVTGIAAILGGRKDEARTFLEQAVSWDREDIRTHYYLGGLLLDSEITADQVRGKSLLYRVSDRQNRTFSESSALLLLVQDKLPLTNEETLHLFEVLDILDTFREGNEALNTDILRRLANKAAAQAPDFAVKMAELVLTYSNQSPNDILGFVDLVQTFGDFEAADSKLVPLVDSLAENPVETLPMDRLLKVRVLQAFANEDWLQAESLLQELLQKHSSSTMVLETFRQLLYFPVNLPHDEQRKVYTAFTELPETPVSLGLPILERLIEIQPLQQQTWLDMAARKYLDQDPLQVSFWLIERGAATQVIDHFSQWPAPLPPPSTRALVEALLVENLTARANTVLAQSGNTLKPAILEFYRARVAQQSGNIAQSLEYWSASHNAAITTGAFPLIQNLGFLALELNQPISALQTLQTAFSAGIPFNESQALRLLDLTLRFGSLPQTLDVATFLHESYPRQPIHLNNLAYFKFVANEEVENFVEQMRALNEEFPEINEYRLTLALGLLQSGRKNEANRLIQGLQMDWDSASDRGLLIYAAVLAQNGQAILAENIVRDIDPEALIPEERAFLGSL